MSERREKQRNLCSDIVELFWSDPLGWPHRAKAVLEDISAMGACVQIEGTIAVNTQLALRLGESGLPGKVRYSTLIGGSYFVGIEFAPGARWTPEDYNPKHILHWPTASSRHENERATLRLSESLNHGSSRQHSGDTGQAAPSCS